MRAEIVGIPPVPTGLTWVSGRVEFSWDSLWSDDVGRPMSPAIGILQPTTRDKFVVPSSLGALFVPATPTGVGVLAGPPMTMVMWMTDSAGNEYRNTTFFKDSLVADGSNQWNVNEQATSVFVTNPGTPPIGLTIGDGDARYVLQGQLATTSQHGLARLATNAEAASGAAPDRAMTPAANEARLTQVFTDFNLITKSGYYHSTSPANAPSGLIGDFSASALINSNYPADRILWTKHLQSNRLFYRVAQHVAGVPTWGSWIEMQSTADFTNFDTDLPTGIYSGITPLNSPAALSGDWILRVMRHDPYATFAVQEAYRINTGVWYRRARISGAFGSWSAF